MTLEQYLELLLGPKGPGSAFDTNESRLAAWRSHSAQVMQMVAAGSRPWAWWEYDAPVPALPREPDLTYLMRCDLLTAREQAALGATKHSSDRVTADEHECSAPACFGEKVLQQVNEVPDRKVS